VRVGGRTRGARLLPEVSWGLLHVAMAGARASAQRARPPPAQQGGRAAAPPPLQTTVPIPKPQPHPPRSVLRGINCNIDGTVVQELSEDAHPAKGIEARFGYPWVSWAWSDLQALFADTLPGAEGRWVGGAMGAAGPAWLKALGPRAAQACCWGCSPQLRPPAPTREL
jgi:hypothetical protein